MRRFDAMSDAFRYSIRLTLFLMIIVSVVTMALSDPIAMMFTSGENTMHLRPELQKLLICMGILMPVFALVYPGSSMMQALRKAGQAMVNTVFRNILIAILFAAAAFMVGDITFIWYMLVIGEITGGLMMWAHSRTVLKDTLRKENRRLKTDETRVKAVKSNNADDISPSEIATS